MGKPKKPLRDLRPEEVEKMMAVAKTINPSYYRMMICLVYGGFRRGEITGQLDYRHGKDKRLALPGLQIEDLQDDGIWVQGKGGYRDFQALRSEVVAALRAEIGKRTKGKIFQYHPDSLYKFIHGRKGDSKTLEKKGLAELAGIADWELIHPHSIRHFFGHGMARKTGKDPWKVRDMMRHRTLQATNRYVGTLDITEKKELAKGGPEFV